ncbi:SPOR domain-containing protein [uncultured Sphingosinicella sp.]|uniref:SPOR domain-containing protein n=1 Tax=uncultured Sphingosinicella sp. TaxID=478748 RepID=UPI0030D6F1FD|tara:strand:- start:81160 stop:82014 length:855 start_codon:yes stop_codon:yes gene_type:complete
MARGYRDDEDDEALPWLEPAEPEDEDEGRAFPYRGLIIAGAIIVATVAVLWFVVEWIGGGRGTDTVAATDEVPLIQAPDGAYKVRPDDPGGLDVDADSLTHSVAEGQDPDSELALDMIPEEPVPVIPAAPVRSAPVPEPGTVARATVPPLAQKALPAEKVQPKPVEKPVAKPPVKETSKPVQKVETPKPAPAKAAAPKPEPAKATGSVTVQLGAFNSTASADQVWSKLSGRVGALGGLRKSVQPVESGGKTLYRLRAGGIASEAQAGSVCAAVQAAGEQCVIVR